MYKFFPEEKLPQSMRIYEWEINNRYLWVKEHVINLYHALQKEDYRSVINNSISIINHSMVILRLVDTDAIGARNKERAKERAKILHERNPGFPEPPKELRTIRNAYEHFEERLDEWAANPESYDYIDLAVGGNFHQTNTSSNVFRYFEGTTLMFWENKINLLELADWVCAMRDEIVKNNRELLFDPES